MAYEKQTWKTGDVITESKLNHIEDGIANSGGQIITCHTFKTERGTTEIYDLHNGLSYFKVSGIKISADGKSERITVPSNLLPYTNNGDNILANIELKFVTTGTGKIDECYNFCIRHDGNEIYFLYMGDPSPVSGKQMNATGFYVTNREEADTTI